MILIYAEHTRPRAKGERNLKGAMSRRLVPVTVMQARDVRSKDAATLERARASPSHPGLHSFPNLEYSVTGLCSSPLAPRVTKRRSFGNACKICFSMAKRR